RYRTRRSIYAACAGVGALAVIWSGVNGWQTYRVNSQAAYLTKQIAAQDTQYQQITRQFPPSPTSGENLKRAVEVAKALRDNTRDPMPMMAVVSSALEPNSNVVLREFGWKYGLGEIEKGMDGTATVTASMTQPAPGVPPPSRRQSAYVSGEIRPFRGDYRAAIDTINGIVSRLRLHPAVFEIKASKLPLNVSPKAALSGNTLDASRTEAGSAEFELIIVFKPQI
ncbi:MAG: hypothetical protein ACXWCS_28675, partial [Burkholderiales bacterium]